MKIDINKRLTRGSQRTLAAFSATLLGLLSNKAFEEITVNELCEKSSYPRATFYNYFEDKYDLLGYCWYCLVEKIFIKDHECHNPEENLFGLFDRIYDFCLEHITILIKILKYNTKEGIMYNHFRMYMNTSTREIFYQCSQTKPCKIPYEILADHYSNTILLILEWSFLKENTCSKEQAHDYLNYLVAAL